MSYCFLRLTKCRMKQILTSWIHRAATLAALRPKRLFVLGIERERGCYRACLHRGRPLRQPWRVRDRSAVGGAAVSSSDPNTRSSIGCCGTPASSREREPLSSNSSGVECPTSSCTGRRSRTAPQRGDEYSSRRLAAEREPFGSRFSAACAARSGVAPPRTDRYRDAAGAISARLGTGDDAASTKRGRAQLVDHNARLSTRYSPLQRLADVASRLPKQKQQPQDSGA